MKQNQLFMNWLLLLFFQFPSFSASFNFLCHHDESNALLHFKSSFALPSDYLRGFQCVYEFEEPYHQKTATWKNGSDCCSWNGVTCDTISGHVIGLDLGCESIAGILHPNSTLFYLTHLRTLDLSWCDFEGEVPIQISHLSKLESLHLSMNQELVWKETTLKRLVQNATNLKELYLDLTNMSSIRPNSLEFIFNQSSSLVALNLQQSGLSGKLKKSHLCLPNIQELDMSENDNLEGQLLDLSCSISLRILSLSDCQFKGPIPLSFSNFTHLTSLFVSNNNLNGSIPSSLLTLPRLTFLYLYDNDLSGQIPNVFPKSNRFQALDLHNNSLEGQIPSSLFTLTQLDTLDCSYNKLEGPLPGKITGFEKLIRLRLNDNLLNGTIPPSFLSLPSLVDLNLTNNLLTGHISAISSYSLEMLSLCGNKLQGNIPKSIFILVNLTTLCLSSNNLSGPVVFRHFSKLINLEFLSLSHNSQLSLKFESNVTYNFSRLIELDLSSLSLTELPKLSRKLSNLDSLDLSNNKLNGKVPSWLIETSASLNLSQNCFTSIDQISRNIDRLAVLDLSFNLLHGELSMSMCNTTSIQFLNLAHNHLTGIIPQCLPKLSSILVLDLQMNKFNGTLPSNFSKESMLHTLNLFGNQLEGNLPNSLSNCTYLELLNLGNNKIEDKFPDWLQTLAYLNVLVLRDNKLYGPIANIKIKRPFRNLIIFDISGNNFSGPLPKAYLKNYEAMMIVPQVGEKNNLQYKDMYKGNFSEYYDSVTVATKGINITLVKIPTIFVSIDLLRNKFEGEIPDVIGELNALKGLNLSHNRLNGSIPQSIGNLTNLESLDLSSNMLTGVIPSELTNLNSLEVLDLSNNHLVGEIPQGPQFNTFSNDSYEGNLDLCGFPLSKKCGPKEPSPASANKFWSEEKFGFGWKPVAIGYGCGFVIGIGLGYFVFLIGKPRWLVMLFGGQPKRRVRRRARERRTNGLTMNQMVQMS